MLLNAVIICSFIFANAESPVNSYSLTGNNNEYDYNNANNGYLGSKNNYQNGASFYNTGDSSNKLSNHISSHSLINDGNQGNMDSDTGNNYNRYSMNTQGSEYTGYSNTYENSANAPYILPAHATSTPIRGYTGSNNNGESSSFNAYSSESMSQDSDFGQYAISSSTNTNNQRAPVYSGYSRPNVLENYSESTADSDVQGYHVSSRPPSYSESDRVYPPHSLGGLGSEYSFGKQKDLYNLKSNHKYNDIYSVPSAMRYTRGNAGHISHNHGVSPYQSIAGPNTHLSKTHGPGVYSSGKSNKYGYKYLSRYAPNSGIAYLSRDRDGFYSPYGKGSGKIIIIKENRPSYSGSHLYSDEMSYTGNNNAYRSKNGDFMNNGAYSTSLNFDNGYSGSSSIYDDATMLRRYRPNGGHMIVQKAMYT